MAAEETAAKADKEQAELIPQQIRELISKIKETNKNYPTSFQLIKGEYLYNTLTLTFKHQRNGFFPSQAVNSDYLKTYNLSLTAINLKKPYIETTRYICYYSYKGKE